MQPSPVTVANEKIRRARTTWTSGLADRWMGASGVEVTDSPAWAEATFVAAVVDEVAAPLYNDCPHLHCECEDADTTMTVLGPSEAVLVVHGDSADRMSALFALATVAASPDAVRLFKVVTQMAANLLS